MFFIIFIFLTVPILWKAIAFFGVSLSPLFATVSLEVLTDLYILYTESCVTNETCVAYFLRNLILLHFVLSNFFLCLIQNWKKRSNTLWVHSRIKMVHWKWDSLNSNDILWGMFRLNKENKNITTPICSF